MKAFILTILISASAYGQVDLSSSQQVKNVLRVVNGGVGAGTFGAFTIFGNNTGSTAAPTIVGMDSLFGSCSGANNALTYSTSSHSFGCNTITPGTGTVTSIAAGTGLSGGTVTSTGSFSLTAPVTVALGGTNAITASAALVSLFPSGSEVGDFLYCSSFILSACATWAAAAGNTSGTKWLQQTASGVPSWTIPTLDVIGNPAASTTFTFAATNLLTIAGTAPASVGTTPGTAAGNQFSVIGTAGGATSITTTGAGGVGSNPSIVGGVGGAATGVGLTTTVGGAGGAVAITGGAGGAGTAGNNSGGAGGNVNITSGAGGAKTGTGTAGAAGNIVLTGPTNINGILINTSGAIATTSSGMTAATNATLFIYGTGHPVSIASTSTADACFVVGSNNCTTTAAMVIDVQGQGRLAGHVFYHSSTPTIGGTGCAAVTGSVDQRGAITLGAGATSCTVTFGTAFVKPMPMVSASTLLIAPVITSISTTILTIGVSSATGTVYYYVDDVD